VRLRDNLITVFRRIILYGSFALAGLALFEKLVNVMGFTFLRGSYAPGRLLEFSAIGLLFVIVLQLREIRILLSTKGSK
jgi:hypothetical protein